MKITTLLETNTTPSSDPAGLQSQQAPKFGRDPHVLEDDEKLDETTAGAIATGEPTNMGMQRRGKGSMLQGIKTSKKFPNSTAVKEGVAEGSESAADIDKKIEFHKQGQAAAQYKGSMNKMHAAKIRELEAKKAALKKQGVAEGYDKWGWHTSLTNGKFMPTKYGNKKYVYLHDLDNESPRGGPQLVTVNKPTVAKRIAQQFGGKVVKTDLNTYRIVKPAEQGVDESVGKLAGLTALGIGAGLAGNYYDQQQPKVEIGGQQAYLIQNPGWGKVPDTAMVLKGKDGKTYKVWSPSRNNKTLYATPVEGIKEQGVAEYGNTTKGQKMLSKVHHRAADRVTSKKADKDPSYARKAQQTQDRAWDRMKDVAEAEKYPEPEQEIIDATRRARLQREREPQGSDNIDARLAQRNAQLQQYTETGKFWLKKKDTQEHISDAYVGKAQANQAALELLKQHPELKGNIVITAWGPGETPMNEAELSEEQLLARDLKKQLELFKQAVDHDLGTKPNDKDLGKKPKDKEVQKK